MYIFTRILLFESSKFQCKQCFEHPTTNKAFFLFNFCFAMAIVRAKLSVHFRFRIVLTARYNLSNPWWVRNINWSNFGFCTNFSGGSTLGQKRCGVSSRLNVWLRMNKITSLGRSKSFGVNILKSHFWLIQKVFFNRKISTTMSASAITWFVIFLWPWTYVYRLYIFYAFLPVFSFICTIF